MAFYLNGDTCPCCGAKINGKNREWLRLFGKLCDALGLEKNQENPANLIDTGILNQQPDAEINPPITARHKA